MTTTGALAATTWWLIATVAALACVVLARFAYVLHTRLGQYVPRADGAPGSRLGADPDVTWASSELGPLGRLISRRLRPRAFGAPVAALAGVLPLAAVLTLLPRLDAVWLLAATAWYVWLAAFASKPPLTATFDWLVPVAFRLVEYALVVVGTAVTAPEALPVAALYVLLASLRLVTLTRRLARSSPSPRWLAVTGGHEARLLVFVGLVVATEPAALPAGLAVLPVGLSVLTIVLAGTLLAEGIAEWINRPAAGTILVSTGDISRHTDRTGDGH